MAIAFVGVSYGQVVTCATGPQTNPTLRAEGQTELLGQMTVTCTQQADPANPAVPATTGTIYIQTSLPITSKQYTAGPAVFNEAIVQITSTGAGGLCVTPATAGCTVQGTVSGNQVSFTLPAGNVIPSGVGNSAQFVISNIRVNASGGGAPQVTESGIFSYNVAAIAGPPAVPATSANTAIAASVQGAGFILKTLGPATLVPLGTSNYTVCAGNPGSPVNPPGTSFTLNINELVSGAFLTQAGEAGQVNPTTFPGTNANIGTASSGDIINVTLANVPSSATINVPQAVTSPGGTILTIANSTAIASGPLSALPTGPEVALTPSSNTVTIPYTVTTGGAFGPQVFAVPVIMQFAANSAAAQGPVTVAVAYGPAAAALAGPASAIPTFLSGTPATANGSSITLCQTTMLFPFVTNQLGFDTGLVLANTSTDNLGVGGKSVAVAQSGTCTLSFYGAGAPTPASGVADPGGSTATATTHAFLLSAVAPGFQGYMIASCPFQYAHGYAFLAYNLTQNNGAVEGYIAEVLNNGRPTSTTSITGFNIATGAATTSTTSGAEPVTF